MMTEHHDSCCRHDWEWARRLRETETCRHFRNARREVLLGLKALIDAGLRHLDAIDEEVERSKEPAHKVEIV